MIGCCDGGLGKAEAKHIRPAYACEGVTTSKAIYKFGRSGAREDVSVGCADNVVIGDGAGDRTRGANGVARARSKCKDNSFVGFNCAIRGWINGDECRG